MKEEQKVWPWAAVLTACVLLAALLCAWVPVQSPAALPVLGGAGLKLIRSETAAEHPEPGRTVVPLGRAVGIKLFSDGVMVVGFSEVATEAGASVPARDCGLKEGDIITHINSAEVDTIEQVQEVLQQVGGDKMSIRACRGEKQVQVTAQAVQCCTDGQYKLGAWIRDSMAGIGTMTFYDPASGLFGALGHGINDIDTAQLMPLESGSIMYAEVTDVQKGECGTPGELHGAFQVTRDLGQLYANTQSGVFGTLTDGAVTGTMPAMEIAAADQVKTGKATILSNIAGAAVEEYEVEITRVYPTSEDTRDLMIQVTDPRLLEATGGIVQGMSGSPIIQNGKLVGAVTHVLVNDPARGYGILAENMLSAANAA